MLRELTSELREFEGLANDFVQSEVLAWRIDSRGDNERVEIALIWGRNGATDAPKSWALFQGYRHPKTDALWRRSLFNQYLKSPLTQLRPGDSRDGTWHAYQQYGHAPTSGEICDFARVVFLNEEERRGYRRVSGELPKAAWLRVTGEEPRCGFGNTDHTDQPDYTDNTRLSQRRLRDTERSQRTP